MHYKHFNFQNTYSTSKKPSVQALGCIQIKLPPYSASQLKRIQALIQLGLATAFCSENTDQGVEQRGLAFPRIFSENTVFLHTQLSEEEP